MTGKRDKIRSVFLTMLMVVSVFGATVAFTGTAAAVPDAAQEPVEFSADTPAENHIEIIYAGDASGIANYTLEDRNGDTVDVEVYSAVSANTSSASRHILNISSDLSGEATLTATDADESVEFDVTTTSSTIENGGADINAYDGERVAVVDLTTTDRDYEIESDGDFLFSGSTGTGSVVTVENTSATEEFTGGNEYNVTFLDGTGSAIDTVQMNLRNLGLSIEADDTSLTYTSGGVDVDGTVTSNVANRDAEAVLLDEDDDEVDSTPVRIDGDREVEFVFSGVEEGNYTVEVEDISTGITDTSDAINVGEVSGSASFAQSVVSEERGDVARITVQMQNRDTASLVIGSERVNYVQEVEVEDGNDDGQVTVLFNTFAPSSPSSFTANAEDDEVELNTDQSASIDVTRPLAGGTSYEMNITSGGVRSADSSVDVDELAVGTLSLRARSTGEFRSWTAASGSASDLDEPDAIAGYAEAGNLTRDSTIADGDVTVLQLQASGIYGALNATNSDNTTDAVVQLNNASAINFSIYESQATIAPNADGAQVLDPNELNHRVVQDPTNNNLYVVFESENLIGKEDAQVDDRFVANFTLPKSSTLTGSNERQTTTTEFRVTERTLDFDTDAQLDDGTRVIQVEAAADQNITGQTSRAPGSEIGINARATGDAPFLLDQDVTVQPDGTFAATFDFSNVSAGQNFTVDASGSYEDDPETQGQVQAAATASVTFDDQSTSGEEVEVASATLSDGGFVTIHDATLQDGDALGSVRGTSDYLEAGSSSGITVTLDDPISETQTLIAMPHQDTNDNEAYDFVSSEGAEDGPYTANGSAVVDSAEVTVEEPTPTATQTDEPTPTETATPAETTAPPSTPAETDTEPPATPTTTEGDGAGFGIAVALIALIGAALLAVRRND